MPEDSQKFTAHTVTPEQKEARVYKVFQTISTDYDKMNDVISLGQHRAWKRALVDQVTRMCYDDILDVASGTGDIALMIAGKNPQAHVTASDFSENMLAVAQKRIDHDGIKNVSISHQNAMEMDFEDEGFDCAVVSFGLRNMPDYARVVNEMVRVLRSGGRFFCLDSSYPTNPIIKPFFKFYFKFVMPLLGRFVAHAPDEYRWLNDSTEAFLTKEELDQLMRDAGLEDVGHRSFMFGGAALHSGIKPLI